jgi:hypothetical protein
MIAMGLLELRVPRQNPPTKSVPPRANRVRDKMTQMMASSYQDPTKGTQNPQALYLSLDQEVSFTPIHVGWHLVVRVLLIGTTRE